jgi:hypothetical protein
MIHRSVKKRYPRLEKHRCLKNAECQARKGKAPPAGPAALKEPLSGRLDQKRFLTLSL